MADDHHLMTKLFLGLLQASRAIKNPVQQTGFFAGYTGSKNPVRNKLKIQFIEFDFSEIKYRSTGGYCDKIQKISNATYRVLNSSKTRTRRENNLTSGQFFPFFVHFFGRLDDTIICFLDFLTFGLVLEIRA